MANREDKNAGFSDYNQGNNLNPNDINLPSNSNDSLLNQSKQNDGDNNTNDTTSQNETGVRLNNIGLGNQQSIPSFSEREKENELFDSNIRYKDDNLEMGSVGNVERNFSPGESPGGISEKDFNVRSVGEEPKILDASDDPISGTIGIIVCVNGKAQFANIYGQIGGNVS